MVGEDKTVCHNLHTCLPIPILPEQICKTVTMRLDLRKIFTRSRCEKDSLWGKSDSEQITEYEVRNAPRHSRGMEWINGSSKRPLFRTGASVSVSGWCSPLALLLLFISAVAALQNTCGYNDVI